MCFIEIETQNFILKFRKIILWRETGLSTHGMKSDEKLFFCQIYAIFCGKNVHDVIDRYFSLFLKGLKFFLNLRLSLIVPLRQFHCNWEFKVFTTEEACNHGDKNGIPFQIFLQLHKQVW